MGVAQVRAYLPNLPISPEVFFLPESQISWISPKI